MEREESLVDSGKTVRFSADMLEALAAEKSPWIPGPIPEKCLSSPRWKKVLKILACSALGFLVAACLIGALLVQIVKAIS